MNIVTHCLAIPEILENIFSYITDYKDFVKLLRVNHIWQLEAVRDILKLYKDRFYRYNHIIFNTLLRNDFYSIIFGIHKPVHLKIFWPRPEDDIHYIDYKEEFEKIQSNVENNIIELQSLYKELLPLIITKKIDNLIMDYLLLENKIDDILYSRASVFVT
jgi:hypothetical protein